jgi:hypothetical protein
VSRFHRQRVAGEEQRATTLELFYDLVFVFAITQVAHLLLVAPALVLTALLVGVLVAVIVAERIAARRRSTRGEPTPLERLESSATA